MKPPITREAARALIIQILGQPGEEPEKAEALFDLLSSIADPTGDVGRFAIAEEILRMVYPHTPQFEKAFKRYFNGEYLEDEEATDGKPN